MLFELLDLKPRNPFLALSLDEALCQLTAQSDYGGGIRLWSNPYSVILGRTCKAEANLPEELLRERAVPGLKKANWSQGPVVARRASGGGTVLHGPGNLNYSMFVSLERYPEFFALKHSYAALLGVVQRSLAAQGVQTSLLGQSDLVIAGDAGETLKVSGNAQFRKHGVLVLHGTLITRPDLIDMISRFLRHPPKEPDYRAGREHRSFLASLPDSFDFSAFYRCFTREFCAALQAPETRSLKLDERFKVYRAARSLVYGCYANPEWIYEARVVYDGLPLGAR
jgi:lipoate---protein ligase